VQLTRDRHVSSTILPLLTGLNSPGASELLLTEAAVKNVVVLATALKFRLLEMPWSPRLEAASFSGDTTVTRAELKGCELCIKLDHKVVQCSSKEELFALRM